MLPRELVEELFGGFGATGLHILVALPDAFDGLLVVLTFPFEVVGQDVVKGISSALPASTGKLLELRQAFGFYWERFHMALSANDQYPMSRFPSAFRMTLVEPSGKHLVRRSRGPRQRAHRARL